MKNKQIIQLFLLIVILLGIFYRVMSLDSADLWFDEARQFWRAKGTQPNDMDIKQHLLEDTLRLDTKQIFEPPMMSILLHFWAKINNSIIWIRILPCIFGIFTLLLMYAIARAVGFNRTWSLTVTSFCSWSSAWIYYSLYLRAYSLVIFCSTLILFLYLKVIENKVIKTTSILGLSLVISLGCLSRYEFWFFIPPLFITTIIIIMQDLSQSFTKKIKNIVVFLTPILITLTYIFFIQLIQQYKMKEHFLSSVPYMRPQFGLNLLQLLSKTIMWQLVSMRYRYLTPNIQTLIISLGVFFLIPIFIIKLIKQRRFTEAFPLGLSIYAIVACVVLSFIGLYPFGPVRYSLFFSPFLLISFFICIKHIYMFLLASVKMADYKLFNHLLITLVAFFLASNIYYGYWDLKYFKQGDMRELITKIKDRSDNVYFYIYRGATPIFKYHYFFSDFPLLNKIDKKNIYLGSLHLRILRKNYKEVDNDINKFLNLIRAKSGKPSEVWFIFVFTSEEEEQACVNLMTQKPDFLIVETVRTRGITVFRIEDKVVYQ